MYEINERNGKFPYLKQPALDRILRKWPRSWEGRQERYHGDADGDMDCWEGVKEKKRIN